ncbi:MAG: Death on curing protein, Doc toxin [uncultured Sulfurovum sp.]|uniref:mRNA interferase n=1 Tax=uncultured Sulfurovum sp. TaxID=269237 RepID=A0A6S6SLP3_9BACT|nr:MAG: Death on curing protein, Doc toxin [uncultured Sulfurovum sp.]
MRYKQYSVVIVNLNPTIGSEIQKTRPYLVISPNEMNYSNVIVAPMTSKKKDYPTRVELKPDSFVVLDQIRTISVQRILKVTDTKLSKKKIDEVKKIIKVMLVD